MTQRRREPQDGRGPGSRVARGGRLPTNQQHRVELFSKHDRSVFIKPLKCRGFVIIYHKPKAGVYSCFLWVSPACGFAP